MSIDKTLNMLNSKALDKLFTELYGKEDLEAEKKRYCDVIQGFKIEFGDKDIKLFSSPGRTEISGNHTDHNHGKVLAGSINLDCVGAAAVIHSCKVNVISVTYVQRLVIDIINLEPCPE